MHEYTQAVQGHVGVGDDQAGGPQQLVFIGVNKTVTATDDMRFESQSALATRLSYTASLRFKGLAGFAEPFLRAEFEALADKVAQRLPSAAVGR
ncbi:hypothetical protein [Streptomyces sp. NBC_01276]|uniref:hypothetical protein n=1 Tax=Streptomyces sp. NBC_01276 TaxID=2903808 RepID=UPI002F9129A8